VGVVADRETIGGRVLLSAGNVHVSAETQAVISLGRQNGPRFHFGLGDSTSYERVEVNGSKDARIPRLQIAAPAAMLPCEKTSLAVIIALS
jgi:hypothetical protein